ncbi:MAG: LCP family protein [Clostridia bacterium]|nr:LCP family protein [Clostridia bacterium]
MYSVRTFLITLALSLVLFGTVAYFATGFVMDIVYPDEEEIVQPDHAPGDLTGDVNARGTVNLLLVCTDQFVYRPSPGGAVESQFNQLADAELKEHDTSIVFLTLVSFNSTTRQVMVTALPRNLLVTASGQEIDLDTAYYFTQKELYGLGSDYFVRSISALLGIQVDYTGYVDIDDYVDVADNLGGLTVEIPEDIESLGITAGEKKLTSNQLYRILMQAEYDDPLNEVRLLTSQCKAILDRITDTAHEDSVYADFERISKVLHTDFTKAQLTEYKDLFFSYRKYQVQMPIAIGQYIASGDELYFRPDRSTTQNLFKQYK